MQASRDINSIEREGVPGPRLWPGGGKRGGGPWTNGSGGHTGCSSHGAVVSGNHSSACSAVHALLGETHQRGWGDDGASLLGWDR